MTLPALTKRLRHKDQAQVQHAVDFWINHGVLHSDSDGSIVLLETSADHGVEQDEGGSMRKPMCSNYGRFF
jgi:hypothetical protein